MFSLIHFCWSKLPWSYHCPVIDLHEGLNITGMLSDHVKGLLVVFPRQHTQTLLSLCRHCHQLLLIQPTCWVKAVYIDPWRHAAVVRVRECVCEWEREIEIVRASLSSRSILSCCPLGGLMRAQRKREQPWLSLPWHRIKWNATNKLSGD